MLGQCTTSFSSISVLFSLSLHTLYVYRCGTAAYHAAQGTFSRPDIEQQLKASLKLEQTTCRSSTNELHCYLSLQIDKSDVTSNPMYFCQNHQSAVPLLSKPACSIHSISVTSDYPVVNQQRTNYNPGQLNNLLLMRSFEKMNWNKHGNFFVRVFTSKRTNLFLIQIAQCREHTNVR